MDKKQLTLEIADHLIAHNGTDDLGRVHPQKKQVERETLETAIKIAETKGFPTGFKAYFVRGTEGLWTDNKYSDEVLLAKIDNLLSEKYENDIVQLITSTKKEELTSSHKEIFNGKAYQVSLNRIGKKFRESPYLILKHYLQIKGKTAFANELKPYHLGMISINENMEDITNELLVKKIDQLLERKYCNIVELIQNTTKRELFQEPFVDNINNLAIYVSMKTVGTKLDNRPFLAIKKFLELKGLTRELQDFKPYHLKKSSKLEDKDIDDILVKKIDSLLESKYHRNINALIKDIEIKDIEFPLIDTFSENNISVSTSSVIKRHNYSTFNIMHRYFELKNMPEMTFIKPYHFKKTQGNNFIENGLATEILNKKIDFLLKNKYHGSIDELIINTTNKELIKTPLQEDIGGDIFEISIHEPIKQLLQNNSVFKMINKYASLRGIKFSYSKACFVGDAHTRRRRIEGKLDKNDLELVRTKDNYNTSRFGFRSFDGKDKNTIRELISEYFIEKIGDLPVTYLGLETEQFLSLQHFSKMLNYDAEQSTIIERNKRTYNTMLAIQKNATNGIRKAVQGLNIMYGRLEDKLNSLSRQYNLINLDTCGHLSIDKEKSINLIFDNQLAAKEGLLYLTLDFSPVGINRSKRAGFDNPIKNVNDIIFNAAKRNGYDVSAEFDLQYEGGTNGRTRNMLIVGYHFKKTV